MLSPATTIHRIIPARAGFTHHNSRAVHDLQDHPRSRGVYEGGGDYVFSLCGSSPLARGLRQWAFERTLDGGIIPARAGFTRRTRSGRSRSWDHPRSRGVYTVRPVPAPEGVGSSPLARGLPTVTGGSGPPGGIIPARAGFTAAYTRAPASVWDHPRSRGVYSIEDTTGALGAGSSPLARGLRGNILGGAINARIIPARAGFTRRH